MPLSLLTLINLRGLIKFFAIVGAICFGFWCLMIGMFAAADHFATPRMQESNQTINYLYGEYDPSIGEISRSDLESIKMSLVGTDTSDDLLANTHSLVRMMYGDTKAWLIVENKSFKALVEKSRELNESNLWYEKYKDDVEYRTKRFATYRFFVENQWLNPAYPLGMLLSK